jgi:hypothetical protein
VAEARAAAAASARREKSDVEERLARLEVFFGLIDAGIGAFVRGEAFQAETLRNVIPLATGRGKR